MESKISLSIITLTKNRAQLLEKCLASLEGQLSNADEIIVIDNNSTDDTPKVILKKKQALPIQTYKTAMSGYPNLYNLAITKSTKQIVVFLDDDCEAAKNFLSQIRERFRKKLGFVLQGKTLSLPRNNIFAEISEDHLTNWIYGNMVKKNMLSVIDNRNVAIPRTIIEKIGGFSNDMVLGSEDVEMGMRLFIAGIPIIYDPQLLTFHHERTALKTFLLQHLRIAKSHAALDKKLSQDQKISMVNKHTGKRHIRSFFLREIEYWRKKRYKDLFYLPLIYVLLAAVRIIGYLRVFR